MQRRIIKHSKKVRVEVQQAKFNLTNEVELSKIETTDRRLGSTMGKLSLVRERGTCSEIGMSSVNFDSKRVLRQIVSSFNL